MMQSSMVTNNSMMRDSAGASPVPDKERNPSMRSKALGGLLAAALSLSPAVAIGVQTAYAQAAIRRRPNTRCTPSRIRSVMTADSTFFATSTSSMTMTSMKPPRTDWTKWRRSEPERHRIRRRSQRQDHVYVGVNGSDGKAETAIEASTARIPPSSTRPTHTSSSPTTARSPCSAKTPTPASTA